MEARCSRAQVGRALRPQWVRELSFDRIRSLIALAAWVALLTCLALPAGRAAAQPAEPLRVTVDREALSTDEVLRLEVVVEVDSGSPPAPILPSFEGFDLLSSSTASQLNIVGGQARSQVTYRYELQPRRFGMLVIEPVRLAWQGETHASPAIPIRVSPGRTPTVALPAAPGSAQGVPPSGRQAPGPSLGRSLFVEAAVDVAEPWVGQQVIYAFRFYQSQRLGRRATYGAPEFTGFYRKEADDQRRYTTTVDGRPYEVVELRTFLFPTAAGEVRIEPATLDIGGSLLRTEALTLEVKPLPPDAPEAFDGAVGQFQIVAAIDRSATQVDEPIRLEVTVSGEGNLDALPEPTWPEIDGWLSYDEGSTTHTRTESSLRGQRVWRRLLIPQRAGTVTVPAIVLPYFEPRAGAYRLAASQPITLVAAPLAGEEAQDSSAALADEGRAEAALEDGSAAEPSPLPEGPRRLRPIEEVRASTMRGTSLPHRWAWLLWLLPLALIGADLARRRAGDLRRAREAADRVGPVRARVQSIIADGRAGRLAAPTAAAKALDAALSLALDRPTAGLTRARLGKALTAALAALGSVDEGRKGRQGASRAGATPGGEGRSALDDKAGDAAALEDPDADLVARTLALYGEADGHRFAGGAADPAAARAAEGALLDAAATVAEAWLRHVEAQDRAVEGSGTPEDRP